MRVTVIEHFQKGWQRRGWQCKADATSLSDEISEERLTQQWLPRRTTKN